jgi:hypothetical protein
MNPVSWVTEKIVSSVATLIGGMVITKVETETLKNQAQALSELEAEAKRHEADGNPFLAEILRENVEKLAKGSPGERTARIEASLHANDRVGLNSAPAAKNLVANPEKKKRGRPPKNAATESKPGIAKQPSPDSNSDSGSEA